VRIPPENAQDPQVVAIKKSYSWACAIGTLVLVGVCVVQYVLWPNYSLIAALYLPLLLVPLSLFTFLPAWKKAVRLKEERGWVFSGVVFADTKGGVSRGSISAIPWLWYVISGAVTLGMIFLAVYRMPYLPEEIPMRFDAAGEVTRYVPTSWGNVLMIPLIYGAMVLVMLGVNILLEISKLQIDPHRPTLSFAQHRVYRRRMGHALGLMTLLLVFMLMPVGLATIYSDAAWVAPMMRAYTPIVLIGSFLIAVPLIVVYVRCGQGGGKLKLNVSEEESDVSAENLAPGRGDDKNWVLGMFYHNPEDPDLLVEDRFGSNIGLNYARVSAKIIAAVVIVGIVGLYVWATIMVFGVIT